MNMETIKMVQYEDMGATLVYQSHNFFVSFGKAYNKFNKSCDIVMFDMTDFGISFVAGKAIKEQADNIIRHKDTWSDTICEVVDKKLRQFALAVLGDYISKHPNILFDIIKNAKEEGRKEGEDNLKAMYKKLMGLE